MPQEIFGITYYTIAEAAELLRVTQTTIRNYIDQGRLKKTKPGKFVLIPEDELRKLMRPF